jgi:uncharacterized repeat protein (TIGR03803 family)
MKGLTAGNRLLPALLFLVTLTIGASAQTFTSIFDFNFADGAFPDNSLIQATDGNLYGYTLEGGHIDCPSGCGTIFRVDLQGAITTVYAFCSGGFPCRDGFYPNAALLQAADGNFYGSTTQGGANDGPGCPNGCGTLYRLTPQGKLTTVYNFCSLPNCADGYFPNGVLVQLPSNDFYGVTAKGGDNYDNGLGTLFKISPSGKLTTLHVFCPNFPDCYDGSLPSFGLTLASDGNLYGTTAEGGGVENDQNALYGTIYRVTLAGTFTTLYAFCPVKGCSDGEFPIGQLVEAPDGSFYGATNQGGDANSDGTLFRITKQGQLTTIHTFDGTDGSFPTGVTLANNGAIYGGTGTNGPYGMGGTFFRWNAGTFTVLHNFCSQSECPDGWGPAPPTQYTNGTLYDTTILGGGYYNICAFGCGSFFSFVDGLHSFVTTNPGFGRRGSKVAILGNELSNATSVTFDGTSANFKVLSQFEILATVPSNANTGTVEVQLSSGTLATHVPFFVIP